MPHTDWTLFLGRLHPLLVHLPIGFLAILAAVELAASLHRFRGAREARGVILAAAAAAAVASVVAGLMLASGGGYDAHLLAYHKWTGIGLATLVVFAAIAHFGHRRRAYVGLLIASLAVLGPASHFGGSMTHGVDYLTAYGPAWMRATPAVPATRPAMIAVADPMAAHLYGDLVRPALADRCVGCHGPDRSSGRLRLDSLEAARRGGQSGGGVDAVVARVLLASGDPKHMPPADQPQLTVDQTDALRWWAARRGDDPTVATAAATADQVALVGRLLHVAVKPTAPADGPRPWAEAGPVVAKLSDELGVGITPAAVDQPWVDVSARTKRGFGDRELAALQPIGRNVASLDLAGSAVTNAGLATVATTMPNLRRLHLERTAVTDAGLAALRPLSHLAYLNLYGTAVTDAGLAALRPLPALTELYVWRTHVTPAAAAAFMAARVDRARVAEWERQIAELRAKIAEQHTAVVGGVAGPTTGPTTGPATAPAAMAESSK